MTTPFNIQNLVFLILSLVGLIIVFAALRSRKQAVASRAAWCATRSSARVRAGRLCSAAPG